MIARAGADEFVLVGFARADLAHRVECPAQFVTADRGQILTLQEDLGTIAGGQVVIPLQRRFWEKRAQGGGGLAGSV